MENINAWSEYQDQFEYFYDIDSFIKRLKSDNMDLRICIKDQYIPGDSMNSILEISASKKNATITYTDNNHPICIDKTGFSESFINKQFFEKHKEAIEKALYELMLTSPNITIYDYMYKEGLIKEIIAQNKVETINFIDVDLSDEDIDLLNENHIEIHIKKDGKRTKINSKYAINSTTFKELKSLQTIDIDTDTKDEELKNLREAQNNTLIKIRAASNMEEEEYLSKVVHIINVIDNLDKPLTVYFECNKRSNLEKTKLLEKDLKNIDIVINNDWYNYSLEEYKKEENILNGLIENIKNSNTSPFEKYIAIYNIVKKFKPYKENKEDKEQSRHLRYILDNEYMVCVGYAKLLEVLLDKVGIESTEYSTTVDTSYDDGFTEEEKPLTHDGHSRQMVHLQDEKYGIDGFYISDPTWDNKPDDSYVNLLMPMDYMQKSKRLFKLEKIDYIFDVHSLEEYQMRIRKLYQKIKSNPSKSSPLNNKKEIKNELNYYVLECDTYRDIYKTIISQIKALDYNYYLKLKEKNLIYSYSYSNYYLDDNHFKEKVEQYKKDLEFYKKFINEIGPYIVSKSNNEIDNQTILKAIINSKLKLGLIAPEYIGDYEEFLLDDMEKQNNKQIPYEFPENYGQESDNGVSVLPKTK